MKIIASICFLVSLHFVSFGQDSIPCGFPGPASLRVDNNGSIYLFAGNVLQKLSAGRQTLQYSKKMFGEIGSIDVSNPHKTLVFFPMQGVCVILDAYFKELQPPLYIKDAGIYDASLACLGSDNSLWCFDNSTRTLAKCDTRMAILSRSPDVSRLADMGKMPVLLVERDDRLFLQIHGFGLLVFDNAGSYLHTIHLPACTALQPVSDKKLFYINNKGVPTIHDFTAHTYRNFRPLTLSGECFYYNNGSVYEKTGGTVVRHVLQ